MIQPAQHVTAVWGHPAWSIMGPDNSKTVPPNAAPKLPTPSTRHKVYAPVPAIRSRANTMTVNAYRTGKR